jgi:hypothetical protein
MSYHNSVKQIFTHCDTKVYPVEYDQKSAYFDVRIDDTFNKTATFMLDNKMGMAEAIDDLYLLDFILKDRDRFLIVFSGNNRVIQASSTLETRVRKKDKAYRTTSNSHSSQSSCSNTKERNTTSASSSSRNPRKISSNTPASASIPDESLLPTDGYDSV